MNCATKLEDLKWLHVDLILEVVIRARFELRSSGDPGLREREQKLRQAV